jgi:pilus assembly protein TadC
LTIFSINDPKKLENLEKYGNPEGPDSAFYEDKYPEFILKPSKKFVYLLMLLIFSFMCLPLALFVIPHLKNPPQVSFKKFKTFQSGFVKILIKKFNLELNI